ncbi:MAG: glycosyltransferase, partial [Thaumarchaeota archaeon]
MTASGAPLVSVVTPCLNAAAYIEQCIRSVKQQDYPNVEHVIVDGKSTDGTLSIIKKHE